MLFLWPRHVSITSQPLHTRKIVLNELCNKVGESSNQIAYDCVEPLTPYRFTMLFMMLQPIRLVY